MRGGGGAAKDDSRGRAEADMDAAQDAASVRIDRIGGAYRKAARDLAQDAEKTKHNRKKETSSLY